MRQGLERVAEPMRLPQVFDKTTTTTTTTTTTATTTTTKTHASIHALGRRSCCCWWWWCWWHGSGGGGGGGGVGGGGGGGGGRGRGGGGSGGGGVRERTREVQPWGRHTREQQPRCRHLGSRSTVPPHAITLRSAANITRGCYCTAVNLRCVLVCPGGANNLRAKLSAAWEAGRPPMVMVVVVVVVAAVVMVVVMVVVLRAVRQIRTTAFDCLDASRLAVVARSAICTACSN